MLIKKNALGLALIFSPLFAHAAADVWTAQHMVSDLMVGSTGHIYAYVNEPVSNPSNCTNSSNRYVLINDHMAFSSQYAALLAGFAAGKKISFNVEGDGTCVVNSPMIRLVRVYN